MKDNVFKKEWIKTYKPTLWFRLKLWLFGETIISVDVAKEGSDTTVYTTYYKDMLYIRKIK